MSRAKLKKELMGMSHEQMVQIVLEAYDARKETRDYFEFFLDPNVEKALEAARQKLEKEFKLKRGYLKFSITKLRAIIKQFESLGVGPSDTLTLMADVVRSLTVYGSRFRISDGYYPVIQRYIVQTLKYANDNGELDKALTAVNELLEGRVYLTHPMRDTIQDALSDFSKAV